MGRKYVRLCVGPSCFRVRSLSHRSKPGRNNPNRAGQIAEFICNGGGGADSFKMADINPKIDNNQSDQLEAVGNKIMVVVDSSLEAKGALEWALSHAVQTQDVMVLLHVIKPTKPGGEGSNGKVKNLRTFELLHSLKNMCQKRRPGVKVEIALIEGKEKGPIIVEEAKRQKVSLLVLGQKRKQSIWRQLIKRWSTRSMKLKQVVDYCIQNASCMTIAVRRKNNKLGGFLITTKRHKSFWLLA